MKIMNPNYVAPADATAATIKAKLTAWFTAHPGVQKVDVAAVQAAVAEASGMSQGQIEQIARDAGWMVDPNA